jgi:hypothetical protein
MRQFDLNQLEVEQIENPELDLHFIAQADPVVEILEAAGFEEITDDEYDAAFTAVQNTLERVNEMLRLRGVNLEFCETDMADFTSFICVRKDETETEFADRVFG